MNQFFSKSEIFDFEISKNESLHSLYDEFLLFSSKNLKFQNKISQLWKIILSKNLEVFLRTIEGIRRLNIKNYLITPLSKLVLSADF